MIKGLRIKNFQKHKNTELDFSPGVNVISGQSDQGKSTIIRALGWCVFNRPSGFDFRSWNADKNPTSVTVELDNGVVERVRSSSLNAYRVQGKELKAVKTDVPARVSKLLNMDERNVQAQHDRYFLVQDTPGEVARKFNAIVGLDIIDRALRKANSIIADLVAEEKVLEGQQKELEKRLIEFSFLDQAQPLVISIRTKINTCQDLKQKATRLWDLASDLKDVLATIEDDEEWLEVEEEYLKLASKVNDLETVKTRYNKLHGVVDDLRSIIKEIPSIEKHLKKYESAACELQKFVDRVGALEDDVKVLRGDVKRLSSVVRELESVTKSIDYKSKELKVLQHKYKKMMEELGVCPLCGSSTKRFKMERIMRHEVVVNS